MNTPRGRPIVVGVDTRPESRLALRWATREAAESGLPVRITTVYQQPLTLSAYVPLTMDIPDDVQTAFDEAVAYVRDRLGPDRVIATSPFIASPAQVLVKESEDAELLVVGSRSRSTLASIALGSVSCAVAAHAKCPVVVVRGSRADEAPERVVVGVDGSEHSTLALDFAFEHAARQGWTLEVVYVWEPVGSVDPAAWTLERATGEREALRQELKERVAPYHAKYPDVTATCHVLEGRPATVLAAQSRSADLVVVGSRGHGGIAGLLLGSVSQGLLHHAQSTVIVVRREDEADRH